MNTKNYPRAESRIDPDDWDRIVHQLRAEAAGREQSEAHRQWIRAATRC